MKVPAKRLSKKELVWLTENTCKKHGATFVSHYNCYLRENPLKLKDYLMKKLYIDRIFKILIVKLYNRTPPQQVEDDLYNNIVSIYLKTDIDIKDLKEYLDVLETNMDIQYKNNKAEYDADFEKEKSIIDEILQLSNNDVKDWTLRGVNGTLVQIINSQENPMDKNEGLKRIHTKISETESVTD